MITCEKQWWFGKGNTCGALRGVPMDTKYFWKLQESSGRV